MSLRTDLRRTWYDALRAAPAILVLALLPSTLYLDHWVDYFSQSLGTTVEETGGAERVSHHSHCHSGPGSCSEQPMTLNSQVFPTIVELGEPEFATVLLEIDTTSLEETVLSIPTAPPRV